MPAAILAAAIVGGAFAGVADSTAPTLSSPVDTVNGPTAATGSVSTNEGTGTLYWVVLLTADGTPSAAQVEAGLKDDGTTPAVTSGSQAVSGTGVQTLSPAPTLLTPSTGYKIAFMHKDAAGNRSTVSVGDGFTTKAVLIGQMGLGLSSVTNPMPVTGTLAVVANDAATVVFSEQAGSVLATTVTDNLGNTYTACNAGTTSGGTTSVRAYRSIITAAGNITTVNIACTASTNDAAADVCAFNGPFSTVDAEPVIKTDANSPMTGTATGTLAQASELVVGMMGSTSTGATITATSGWTLAGTPATTGARRASTVYKNVEATTSVTPSFDVSNGTDNAAVQTVSFRRSA